MANIIRILLFRGEEDLACYLTAFYEITLDSSIIKLAVHKKNYRWLQFVWAFKKNHTGDIQTVGIEGKRHVSYERLFEFIHTKYRLIQVEDPEEKIKEEIQICCEWMVDGDDNILEALLFHMKDYLCLKYMGYYSKFVDEKLFLFSLYKNNYLFIPEALCQGAFEKQSFKQPEVVEKILEYMKIGSKTNFLLNTLLLIDVFEWKNKYLQKLIAMFEDFIEDDYEDNRLLLSYNPMMSIALSAELLGEIGKQRKRFANQCRGLREQLLELGKVYNSKITNEDYFKKLIMQTDF